MDEIQAIQMLQKNPLAFLRANAVTPYCASTSRAGIHTFYMVDTHDQIRHPARWFGHLYIQQGKRFKIRARDEEGGQPFHAFNLPVQASNVSMRPIPLYRVGANIMVTTHLTGCSVVLIPDKDRVSVAHLQPIGESGAMLRRRLAAKGYYVFGAPDYADSRASLIGARLKGRWKFFVQKQDENFNVTDVRELRLS